jgi:ribonuclease D
MNKGPVRVANWERFTLTEEQREYAATDAYVCNLLQFMFFGY